MWKIKTPAVGWALAIFVCVSTLAFQRAFVSGASSSWLNSPLTLTKLHELSGGESVPYAINGNRDCTERKITTRPANFGSISQTEHSSNSCVVDTAYGAVATTGYLQRQGTSTWGEVRKTTGGLANIIPVPRSDTAVQYSSAPMNGLYLFFTGNFGASLRSSTLVTGEVSHIATAPFTASLKDKSGNLLRAQVESLSFSGNGQWMIVDVPFIGMVRVNLSTFEVLPFGGPFNYDIGLAPGIQSAISSDGRWAVQYSKIFPRFRVYDLSTCGPVPNTLNGPVSCQFRDLSPFIQDQIPGFSGLSTARFFSSGGFSFYATSSSGSASKTAQYTLRLPDATNKGIEYLALGDSYISGEGAYHYKSLTDTKISKCHLSLQSYPYLIGSDLAFNKYESVACSGAKIYDITNNDNNYRGQVLDTVKLRDRDTETILNDYSPGYLPQKDFVEKYAPSTIVMSAGGNDIGFGDKIKRCVAEPDTCFSTYEDRLETLREINNQFDRLVSMYQQLKVNGKPDSKIYVIGYPQITDPSGNCALNVHLNQQELLLTQSIISHLNRVIELASKRAGVTYVDVEDALAGHRLCETASHNVAINGLTAGDDDYGFARESYHPNQLGHQLLKQKILDKTQNLSLPMPKVNTDITLPPESTDSALLNAPVSGRKINRLNYDDNLGNDIVYRGGVWQSVLDGLTHSLKPSSSFILQIHSDPIGLGSVMSDAAGNLSISTQVPATAPVGFHTLHVYGKNVADEPIDIYKTVYIADLNNLVNDTCRGLVKTSRVDIDQDSIDDSCDAMISEPPRGGVQISESSVKASAPIQTQTDIGHDSHPVVTSPELLVYAGGTPQVAGANTHDNTLASQSEQTYSLPGLFGTSKSFPLSFLLISGGVVVGTIVYVYKRRR